MSIQPNPSWQFVSFDQTEREELPGKIHHWYCKPDKIPGANLLFVRAHLMPGEAHRFHHHPQMEEILYVLSGKAEQWAEKEHRMMGPGDSFYVPQGIVHATYNVGSDVLDFLAILSPARIDGPITVEVSDQEPWRTVRR
jgi:quercetin dioxygenase-like cupin family protein